MQTFIFIDLLSVNRDLSNLFHVLLKYLSDFKKLANTCRITVPMVLFLRTKTNSIMLFDKM